MFDHNQPITLARQGEGPEEIPADGQAATEQQAPAGSTPAGGGGGAPRFDSLLPMMLLVVVAVIVFSVMGQRRERKKREAMIGAIKKHDRVQTIGGVIGSVVEVKSDQVVLKVDESSNTRMTFARSAIQQVLREGASTGSAPTEGSLLEAQSKVSSKPGRADR